MDIVPPYKPKSTLPIRYMSKLISVCLILVALSVAVIGAAFPSDAPAAAPPPKIKRDFDEAFHKKCLYPTVRISTEAEGQKSTGFIVRSTKVGDFYHNVVVTCQHCIRHKLLFYQVEIAVYENDTDFVKWEAFRCHLYAWSEAHDLAVVLFKTPYPVAVAEMDFDRKMCIGNDVSHIGCGGGDQPRFDKGQVTSTRSKIRGHDQFVYRTNVFSIFGDSGGPAFYKHKVVGVMQAIRVGKFQIFPMPMPQISFYIPIGQLKVMDGEQNNSIRFLYTPRTGLPIRPYAELDFMFDWPKFETDYWEE